MIRTKPKKSRVTKDGRVILAPRGYQQLKERKRFEQNNLCADCQRPNPTDLHHIKSRGLGGSKRDDTEQNTKLLCRDCHQKYSSQPAWSKR